MVAAGVDADDRAVAHQRGIERNRDIARRRELAEMRPRASGSFAASAAASDPTVRPRSSAAISDSSGTNAPSTKTSRRHSTSPSIAPAVLAPRLGRGIGRARQRLCLAHQRAQVGVLPLLDAAMRQALLGEQVEGGRALRRDRVAARQPRARLGKGVRQSGLRRGLDHLSRQPWHSLLFRRRSRAGSRRPSS